MTKQGSPIAERSASFKSATPTTKKEQKKLDKMRKFAENFQMSRGPDDSPETPKSSEASSINHLSPKQDKQRKVGPLVHISDANPSFGGLGGLLPQNCKNITRELAS